MNVRFLKDDNSPPQKARLEIIEPRYDGESRSYYSYRDIPSDGFDGDPVMSQFRVRVGREEMRDRTTDCFNENRDIFVNLCGAIARESTLFRSNGTFDRLQIEFTEGFNRDNLQEKVVVGFPYKDGYAYGISDDFESLCENSESIWIEKLSRGLGNSVGEYPTKFLVPTCFVTIFFHFRFFRELDKSFVAGTRSQRHAVASLASIIGSELVKYGKIEFYKWRD